MSATNVETLTNPRDSLPNVYNNVTAREVDFVTRFGQNWDALREILGIMRPIKKTPGTQLISYTADVTLESGAVEPGEVIPYSKATITQAAKDDLTIEKYAKAVPIEDVSKYGASIAVQKSDEAFLTKLQNVVLGKFYTFLNTGSLTGTATSWQAALAKAQGEVLNKWAAMQKDVTAIVGFANILDAYDYLGTANISVQTQFGMTYIKDFLGYSTLFLLPANQIARNTVLATPIENIDLYYIDPNDADFRQLGLDYTVQGETNLVGFHANGNYSTAVGESFALMGMALWAEYLNGIAKITVNSGDLTPLTMTPKSEGSYWGTSVASMQDGLAVSNGAITGTLNYLTSGQLVTDWGEGYFIAVGFDGFSSGLTYSNVKVGLHNSAGSGLVTLDSDKDAVIHITDPVNQKLMAVQTDSNGKSYTQYWDLSKLTYAPKA